MNYIIPQQLAQQIVSYLERQPFCEVAALIAGLTQMAPYTPLPARAKTTEEKPPA